MERQFYIMRQNRQVFLNLVESLTIEQLNEIPAGFNNNIAWNFNHMVVIPQVLLYRKSGVSLTIPAEKLEKYARGTRPESFISLDEIGYYKSLALDMVDRLEKDWNSGLFKTYDAFTTSMGVLIAGNEDALHYTVTHDFLHLGYALAQKRMVLNKSMALS